MTDLFSLPGGTAIVCHQVAQLKLKLEKFLLEGEVDFLKELIEKCADWRTPLTPQTIFKLYRLGECDIKGNVSDETLAVISALLYIDRGTGLVTVSFPWGDAPLEMKYAIFALTDRELAGMVLRVMARRFLGGAEGYHKIMTYVGNEEFPDPLLVGALFTAAYDRL